MNVKTWKAKDFVVLFYRLLQETFELPPGEYHQLNMARDCITMKEQVVGFFAENGYDLEEVRRFLEWFFRVYIPSKRTREVPRLSWLKHSIVEYFVDTKAQKRPTAAGSPTGSEQEFRREAYRKDLEYFGLAHRHGDEHRFTKWEYWLGFWWRRRNLGPEQMADFRRKQWEVLIERFGEVDAGVYLYRFHEWEREYLWRRKRAGRHVWNVRMRYVFIQVQARRREWSLERVRSHYGLGS